MLYSDITDDIEIEDHDSAFEDAYNIHDGIHGRYRLAPSFVILEPEYIRRQGLMNRKEFRIVEAVKYLAGCVEYKPDVNDKADFNYRYFALKLFESFKADRLELTTVCKTNPFSEFDYDFSVDWRGRELVFDSFGFQCEFDKSGRVFDFALSKISRETLIQFCEELREYPPFLFPAHDVSNEFSDDIKKVDKGRNSEIREKRDKRKADAKINRAVIREAVQSLLDNADKPSAYKHGSKFSGTAIAKKLVPGEVHSETGYSYGQFEKIVRQLLSKGKIRLPK